MIIFYYSQTVIFSCGLFCLYNYILITEMYSILLNFSTLANNSIDVWNVVTVLCVHSGMCGQESLIAYRFLISNYIFPTFLIIQTENHTLITKVEGPFIYATSNTPAVQKAESNHFDIFFLISYEIRLNS